MRGKARQETEGKTYIIKKSYKLDRVDVSVCVHLLYMCVDTLSVSA